MRHVNRAMRIAGALAFALSLSACESFDLDSLFSQKKPVQGERKPVFPEGVPGVSQGVPPELVRGYQPPAEPQQGNEPPAEQPRPVARPPRQPRSNTVAAPRAPATNVTVQPGF